MKFTAEEKLKCVEREIAIRKRVYPNRVETGRMTSARAILEQRCMEAIAEDYREQAQREKLL